MSYYAHLDVSSLAKRKPAPRALPAPLPAPLPAMTLNNPLDTLALTFCLDRL